MSHQCVQNFVPNVIFCAFIVKCAAIFSSYCTIVLLYYLVHIVCVNVTDILTMGDNVQTSGSAPEPEKDPRVTEDPNPGPEGVHSQESGDKPVCVIVLGMAGSGKTTFVQR